MFGNSALRQTWPTHRGMIQTALVASLTLGLAPFVPHPHVYKQLVALANGTLSTGMDVFDLFLHGAPWVALAFFLGRFLVAAARTDAPRPRSN
jgi:hypothetical protein